MKCRRRPAALTGDPWVDLAAAIVQRAIWDVTGYALLGHDKRKPELPAQLAGDALTWLEEGAGGLLAAFGLDEGAVVTALRQKRHGLTLLSPRHKTKSTSFSEGAHES